MRKKTKRKIIWKLVKKNDCNKYSTLNVKKCVARESSDAVSSLHFFVQEMRNYFYLRHKAPSSAGSLTSIFLTQIEEHPDG